MSTVATRAFHDIRRALLAHEELALIDVREEDPFAQAHPLFAANIPLSKLELEVFARVPGATPPSPCMTTAKAWRPRPASV